MLTIDKDVQYLIFADILNQKFLDIVVTPQDRQILRELGAAVADIGTLPIQAERRRMWTRLNGLDMVKPMVWLNELPWNEMAVNEEVTLHTSSPFCQRIESELIQTLYLWTHMPVDMVVEPVIYPPMMVHNTGIGVRVEDDMLGTGEDEIHSVDGSVNPWETFGSHRYHRQIADESDLDKITAPKILTDEGATQDYLDAYTEIFDGVLEVRKRGIPGFWFAPWDDIIMLTDAQQTLMELITRPDFLHKLVDRLVTVYLDALDQYESQSLLALNNTNRRIGSGAYGYTDDLPRADFDPDHIQPADMWGSSAAQIFAEVSPAMHEEFGLAYERRWLERFGLTYYGCCEPLARKIDILKSIGNLRKVSVSPWNDRDEIAEKLSDDYVFSFKPSPAVFAQTTWEPDAAREELHQTLSAASRNHCQVEIIMKDITTVRHEPQRLWEWAQMAAEITAEFS